MKKFLILILVLFFLLSCGKKQIKPPSEEYRYTKEAFRVVEELILAYQNKDNAGIRKHCSESAYREIIASIRPFEKAEIDLTPVLGEMEGDMLRLYVSWNGKWVYSDREIEERGLAVFLMKGNPPRVERILRGSPFRYPD